MWNWDILECEFGKRLGQYLQHSTKTNCLNLHPMLTIDNIQRYNLGTHHNLPTTTPNAQYSNTDKPGMVKTSGKKYICGIEVLHLFYQMDRMRYVLMIKEFF